MLSTAVQDRALGALLGLAVGDALGTTLEFSIRDSLPHHTEMTGGGPFRLAPGQWTDDTAMALALADSLISCRGLDPHDLMTRFVAWWREGAYSCTGICFDIGRTTAEALARFERTGNPFAGSKSPRTAGNGSLMRLAPVVLFALGHADVDLDALAADQSRTTHAAPQAVEACVYFARLLRAAIQDGPEALRALRAHEKSELSTDSLHLDLRIGQDDVKWKRKARHAEPAIQAFVTGSWRGKTRHQIRSSGFVLDTLEAALWCVGTTSSFEEALILAVHIGDDADTVGAVTGQLAGAFYGATAIPPNWQSTLAWSGKISDVAFALMR